MNTATNSNSSNSKVGGHPSWRLPTNSNDGRLAGNNNGEVGEDDFAIRRFITRGEQCSSSQDNCVGQGFATRNPQSESNKKTTSSNSTINTGNTMLVSSNNMGGMKKVDTTTTQSLRGIPKNHKIAGNDDEGNVEESGHSSDDLCSIDKCGGNQEEEGQGDGHEEEEEGTTMKTAIGTRKESDDDNGIPGMTLKTLRGLRKNQPPVASHINQGGAAASGLLHMDEEAPRTDPDVLVPPLTFVEHTSHEQEDRFVWIVEEEDGEDGEIESSILPVTVVTQPWRPNAENMEVLQENDVLVVPPPFAGLDHMSEESAEDDDDSLIWVEQGVDFEDLPIMPQSPPQSDHPIIPSRMVNLGSGCITTGPNTIQVVEATRIVSNDVSNPVLLIEREQGQEQEQEQLAELEDYHPDRQDPTAAERRRQANQKMLRQRGRKLRFTMILNAIAIILLVLCCITILLVIRAVILQSRSNNRGGTTDTTITTLSAAGDKASSPNEPTREDYLWSLLPGYTKRSIDRNYTTAGTADIHSHKTTAQTKAFHWTTRDPNFKTYDDWRLLQRLALATLYYSTNGDSWTYNKNWLSYDVDEYSWFSQSILETSVVSSFLFSMLPTRTSDKLEIDLRYYMDWIAPEESEELSHLWLARNNLIGSIPPEFYLLTQLRTFDFTSNPKLHGTISSHIGNLTKLEIFSFIDNDLSGVLPSQMGKLTKLVAPAIAKNKRIGGTIPSELSRLTNLLNLAFWDCSLTGAIPSELGVLSTMPSWISLNGNLLSGTIPSELGLMRSVYFDVSTNHLTGTIPSELASYNMMPNRLDVEDDLFELGGELFPGIDLRKTLDVVAGAFGVDLDVTSIITSRGHTSMHLSNNYLTGLVPSELGMFEDINRLDLSFNMLSGQLPPEMGQLTGLSRLHLHDNEFVGSIPSSVCQIESLTSLRIDCDPSPFSLNCTCGAKCQCDRWSL